MATPRGNTYIVASGRGAYAGRADPDFAWAASVPANTWTALSASTDFMDWAQSGGIPAGAYIGTDPFGSIVSAYCDPAFDGRNLYFYGGGHGDGNCNAVIKLDTARLQYTLVGAPTPPAKYPPKYGPDRLLWGGSSTQPGPMEYPSGLQGNGFFLPAPPLTDPADLPYATPMARVSTHMYGAAAMDTSTGKVHYFYLSYGEFDTGAGTWAGRGYDIVAALVAINPSLGSFNPASAGLTTGTSAIYDAGTSRFVVTLNHGDNAGGNRSGLCVFEPTTRTIESLHLTSAADYRVHIGGETLIQVGRKLYVFTKVQASYSSPTTMSDGYIFDLDTKARQKFVIAGGATLADDCTYSTYAGWPQDTIPGFYDGAFIWRWNYGPASKRGQFLRLNLTPSSGSGTLADPFVLQQTNVPITGVPAGTVPWVYKRLVWVPGAQCAFLVGDPNHPAYAIKPSAP